MNRLNREYLFIAIALIIIAIATLAIYNISKSSHVRIFIATTTSLYQTGLLDYLATNFRKGSPNVDIVFLPIGSGEALERAARGDACAVLIHAPSLEVRYIANRAIYNHKIFAYNSFIVVGPQNDPANISRAMDPAEAFRRIFSAAEKGLTVFVSRGDRSGTNVKELQLWRKAGISPGERSWYKVCGCGMAQALVIANELKGYTLSDISTFLALKSNGTIRNLENLFNNSSELVNIYSAYLSAKCSGQELEYAEKFIEFITSAEGQNLISSYGREKYGAPLFNPAIGREKQLLDIWNQLSSE